MRQLSFGGLFIKHESSYDHSKYHNGQQYNYMLSNLSLIHI